MKIDIKLSSAESSTTYIKYYNKTNRIKHSYELDGSPPSAGGGSCVFGTVGAECAPVKGVTNLHLVHPSAPGGIVHMIHLHTQHALCVLKLFTFMRTRYVCFNILHSKHRGRFFFNIKLESHYQAPVV